MKIIFMGTPQFAIPTLDALCNSKHKVVAVVTGEDKPRGRGLNVTFTPIKNVAIEYGVECLQPKYLKDENFIQKLKQYNADVFVVVAFKILSKEVFTIPKFGSINAHTSLLPKYRGAAPINWAIINGERETGITTFFLNDNVDTGDIILQHKINIPRNMDAGILHDALATTAANVVLQTLDLIENSDGKISFIKQNSELATPAPKIFKEHCKINWNSDFENIFNFIRGLSPRPTAFTNLGNEIYKIYRIEDKVINFENENLIPGKIKVEDDKLFVSLINCWCQILEIQKEGKKRMTVCEFLRGTKFAENDIFS